MIEDCPYEQRILKERKLFFVFSLLALAVPIFSLIGIGKPENEELSIWFQRSGSIMVVLALLAEMRAYQMFDVFKPIAYVSSSYDRTHKKYKPQVTAYNYIAFALIGAGTVIWGYGDILAKML